MYSSLGTFTGMCKLNYEFIEQFFSVLDHNGVIYSLAAYSTLMQMKIAIVWFTYQSVWFFILDFKIQWDSSCYRERYKNCA